MRSESIRESGGAPSAANSGGHDAPKSRCRGRQRRSHPHQLNVQDELGWLSREQPTEDVGIDAHVEIVDTEEVPGRLLALQIKSGQSWFKEATRGGWWFRPDAAHVQYWLNHFLPVVAVLCEPDSQVRYWQLVSRETMQRTRRGVGSCSDRIQAELAAAEEEWQEWVIARRRVDTALPPDGAADTGHEAAGPRDMETQPTSRDAAKPKTQGVASRDGPVGAVGRLVSGDARPEHCRHGSDAAARTSDDGVLELLPTGITSLPGRQPRVEPTKGRLDRPRLVARVPPAALPTGPGRTGGSCGTRTIHLRRCAGRCLLPRPRRRRWHLRSSAQSPCPRRSSGDRRHTRCGRLGGRHRGASGGRPRSGSCPGNRHHWRPSPVPHSPLRGTPYLLPAGR